MRRLRIVLAVCAVLLCGAVCAWRIHDVNARAIRYPTERYAMGEDVPLEGCFFADASEGTDGYVLRVEGVEVMSYNEYVTAYGLDGAQTIDGLDVPSIICLTVTIANNSDKGSEEGGFNIVGMGLAKPNGDALMRVDVDLWGTSEASIASAAFNIRTGILPHTTYTTHIPFSAGLLTRETLLEQAGQGVDPSYTQPVEEGLYDLHLSVQPKRKLVSVQV